MFFPTKLAAVFGLLTLATAAPNTIPNSLLDVRKSEIHSGTAAVEKRGISCDSLVHGLNKADCQHMSSIGMVSQGVNAQTSNGNIWIGDDGPNTFTFKNNATGSVPITLVIWSGFTGDYLSSFVNVRQAKVTYSLPDQGDSVTISMANGVSGGWATLNNHNTTLSSFGQIDNTWGEFTTGSWATVDVSREVNMLGNKMHIKVASSGCVSDMDTCVFVCKSGQTCGESGTYSLSKCDNGMQTTSTYGLADGVNPSGGCQGFNNGGHVNVTLSH